jgi:hypothetical protein
MDTTSSVQTPPRPPIDTIAEAMWKIASGECQESWVMLPEDQKGWWRKCATECVRRWMKSTAGSYY